MTVIYYAWDFRAKSSRVITYEEFQKALEDLALKKFKGQSKEEALQSIHKLIEGKEPTNVGVTVSDNLTFACLIIVRTYIRIILNKTLNK